MFTFFSKAAFTPKKQLDIGLYKLFILKHFPDIGQVKDLIGNLYINACVVCVDLPDIGISDHIETVLFLYLTTLGYKNWAEMGLFILV